MIEQAIAALIDERAVVLPTDTVYGLCALPTETAVAELYRVKGRPPTKPTALVAHGTDPLLALIPELDVTALREGAYTFVVPNPARRLSWLAGDRPETIGVRLPALPPEARAVLERVGPVAATSANAPGGADPRVVDEIPEEIRARCGAIVDAGELPGVASTVVDLTGDEPRILRQGAGVL